MKLEGSSVFSVGKRCFGCLFVRLFSWVVGWFGFVVVRLVERVVVLVVLVGIE